MPYYGDSRYSGYMPGRLHQYDYANWGYIILYLVVIFVSVMGNSLFIVTIKKNPILHRTPHFLLLSLAIRDLIVTLLVIPFVTDSQAVNLMEWKAGEIFCKLYAFLNYGTLAEHSFNLIFLLLFLYFWYRKQEAYVTEEGTTVIRKTKMHKWAIILIWVIALGMAIPAGSLAWDNVNSSTRTRTCEVWHGNGRDSSYYVQLTATLVGFVLPCVILVFPCIALLMQLCGAREPKLDPPHNRIAATGLALILVYVATRAPFEGYLMMKLFHQSGAGIKFNSNFGTPYAFWNFETEMILTCLIYVACAIHPLLYFALNPQYRKCLKEVWKTMYCNKDSTQRERENSNKKRYKEAKAVRQFPSRNRLPAQMRHGQEPLMGQRQPIIMSSVPQQQQQQQPQGYYPQQPPQMVPMQMTFQEQQQMKQIAEQQQFMDTSFDRMSPTLPPVFEFEGMKYIDTGRVEPKIAYSPEKTPPKTPETPRYEQKPFQDPVEQFLNNNQWSPTPLNIMPQQPPPIVQMADISPPIATSEPISVDFKVENLDNSPGSTLRSRASTLARQNVDDSTEETVEILQESPGSKYRRRLDHINGNGNSSRPTSPPSCQDPQQQQQQQPPRPASRSSGVEIIICGRTRSRTDLCPDIPRSKFEHSV